MRLALALKMEEGTTSLENLEKLKAGSLHGAAEGVQPCQHLDFSSVRPRSNF